MADINGFAPSEDSRKHKFGVGVDSPPRSCAQGKFGQEARVTPVLDAGLGHRQSQRLGSEAWFPSPDAMRHN